MAYETFSSFSTVHVKVNLDSQVGWVEFVKMCPWEHFQKQLIMGALALIRALIHWWIQIWVHWNLGSWWDCGRGGVVKGQSRSLGACHYCLVRALSYIASPLLSISASVCHEENSLLLLFQRHNILFHCGGRLKRSEGRGWKSMSPKYHFSKLSCQMFLS